MCCPFFPRDVLDEIWDLIESVSGVFLPTLDIFPDLLSVDKPRFHNHHHQLNVPRQLLEDHDILMVSRLLSISKYIQFDLYKLIFGHVLGVMLSLSVKVLIDLNKIVNLQIPTYIR